ncbi:MAG TPA: hypothetical protein VFZ77_05960 [Acidimicrobiales bacterium]
MANLTAGDAEVGTDGPGGGSPATAAGTAARPAGGRPPQRLRDLDRTEILDHVPELGHADG